MPARLHHEPADWPFLRGRPVADLLHQFGARHRRQARAGGLLRFSPADVERVELRRADRAVDARGERRIQQVPPCAVPRAAAGAQRAVPGMSTVHADRAVALRLPKCSNRRRYQLPICRTAPPAPFLPQRLHGRPIIALAACYAGSVDNGWRALASLREFGDPADSVAMRPVDRIHGLRTAHPTHPHPVRQGAARLSRRRLRQLPRR